MTVTMSSAVSRLHDEVQKRMRVRHTFNAWVRKQFVEAIDPEQFAQNLYAVWKIEPATPVLRMRITEATAELVRVQSIHESMLA